MPKEEDPDKWKKIVERQKEREAKLAAKEQAKNIPVKIAQNPPVINTPKPTVTSTPSTSNEPSNANSPNQKPFVPVSAIEDQYLVTAAQKRWSRDASGKWIQSGEGTIAARGSREMQGYRTPASPTYLPAECYSEFVLDTAFLRPTDFETACNLLSLLISTFYLESGEETKKLLWDSVTKAAAQITNPTHKTRKCYRAVAMVLKSFIKCLLGKKSLPLFMMESAEVTFHLKNVPATISQVAVYGSSPELGNWQLNQIVPMQKVNSGYQATLALCMSSYPYYYKYVTLDENRQPVVEKGGNRLVYVRDDMKPLDIHDAWRFRLEAKEGESEKSSQRRSTKMGPSEPIQYHQPISEQSEKEQLETVIEEMSSKISRNDITRLTQAMELWIQTKQLYHTYRYGPVAKEISYSIFDSVPQEILDYIFQYTLTWPTIEDSARDLSCISLVSKRFARIMLTESMYKHLTLLYWPKGNHNVENSSWRFVLQDLWAKKHNTKLKQGVAICNVCLHPFWFGDPSAAEEPIIYDTYWNYGHRHTADGPLADFELHKLLDMVVKLYS